MQKTAVPAALCSELYQRSLHRFNYKLIKGMFGRVRTKLYRGYSLVKYPTEHCRSVRYDRNTLRNTPVRFGGNSKPVPETSVSSV